MCMILELWFIQFLNNCTVNIICCCCMLIKSCFELKVSNIVFILRMSKYLVYNCSRNSTIRLDTKYKMKSYLIINHVPFFMSRKNMKDRLRNRSTLKFFWDLWSLGTSRLKVLLVYILIIGLCCYRSWCLVIIFVFFPFISLILI